MSKYARVNSLTKRVINVIEADYNFINQLPDYDLWVETSNELTGQEARVGDTYDVDTNSFKSAQPFSSWVFNNNTWEWEPPIPMPAQVNTEVYQWDEEAHQANNSEGWISDEQEK